MVVSRSYQAYNAPMEKHKEIAKNGYTNTVLSHVLDIHIFSPEFLTDNTPQGLAPESLADVSFTETTIPCLKHSSLTFHPETDVYYPELRGEISSFVPYEWVGQKYEASTVRDLLEDFLREYDDIIDMDVEIGQSEYQVTIEHFAQFPISISVEFDANSELVFNLEVPLTENRGDQYSDLSSFLLVWGAVHDFIAESGESSSMPIRYLDNHPEHRIFVGKTDRTKLSDVEHIFADTLTKYALLDSSLPTPQLSASIDYETIEDYSLQLTSKELVQALHLAISKKRRRHQAHGTMNKIKTNDITQSIDEVRRHHHQGPDENSHRDSHRA